VADGLRDADPRIVLEAARAIHDMPIGAATPQLAALISDHSDNDALLRRVLNANYRLGTPQHAQQLAGFAARSEAPLAMRLESLEMLAAWATPSGRDRVLGMWRPLEPRPAESAAQALRGVLGRIVDGEPAVAAAAARIAAQLGISEAGPILHRMQSDQRFPAADRARLLDALPSLNYPMLEDAVQSALLDQSPEVRLVARRLLVNLHPQQAIAELEAVLGKGELIEQQAALATLGDLIENPSAVEVLLSALEQLLAGTLAPGIELDLVEAAQRSTAPPVLTKLQQYQAKFPPDVPVSRYRAALAGGNAERGRLIFQQNISLSCLRCHQVGEQGGRVGPNLSDIGQRKTREYLLESLVDPNRTIAEGFGTVVLVTEDGLIRQGVVSRETEELVYLFDAEARSFAVAKEEIVERRQGQSAMPADLTRHLTPFDVRDLVEYLATLRSAAPTQNAPTQDAPTPE
jgi:quinoprotein glucose dehydrogenase